MVMVASPPRVLRRSIVRSQSWPVFCTICIQALERASPSGSQFASEMVSAGPLKLSSRWIDASWIATS